MKTNTVLPLISLLALASARPMAIGTAINKREVPQEHSHEQFLDTVRTSLNTNNPAAITDPVFGLLGDAAAAGGKGSITDVECLQQATADQAFTNAKAANDVNGMTAALIYRALERNTGKVGLASNSCTTIQAVNPEIAALSQHQDPASTGAAATNKAIALELAKQIASIGGNATEAINSGTFAPGSTSDDTGKGNTCDTTNDPIGCIFTQNLLVPDVTTDEINAAIAGTAGTGSTNGSAAGSASSSSPAAAAAPAAGSANSSTCAAASSGAAVTSNTTSVAAGSLDFGSCPDAGIVFGPGFDGRNQDSFEPANTTQFTHGSALNIGVITSFMIDRFKSNCAAGADPISAATAAQTATQGKTGQAAADAWNSGLGLTDVPVLTSSANASAASSASTATSSTTSSSSSSSSSSLDLGSCTNPTIVFGPGFDGRTEESFEPANEADFNHGSADNIAVISGFICQQLQDKCKASSTATAACASGSAAASKASGQAAADAFNAAF